MQKYNSGKLFWCRKINSRRQTITQAIKHPNQTSIQSITKQIIQSSMPNAYDEF
jgi:hypothetical protein